MRQQLLGPPPAPQPPTWCVLCGRLQEENCSPQAPALGEWGGAGESPQCRAGLGVRAGAEGSRGQHHCTGGAIPIVRPFGKVLPAPAWAWPGLPRLWLLWGEQSAAGSHSTCSESRAIHPLPSCHCSMEGPRRLCSPSRHRLRTLWHDWGGTLASHKAGQEPNVGGLTEASPGTGTLTGISTLLRDWGSPRDQDSQQGRGREGPQ